MNDDLKIDVYQRVVNEADSSEKEDVKITVCVFIGEEIR